MGVVCTTVAVRGLDFPRVRHVVLYDITGDEATFVHSAGRTARRGEQGLVSCLVVASSGQRARGLHQLQAGAKIHFEKVAGS